MTTLPLALGAGDWLTLFLYYLALSLLMRIGLGLFGLAVFTRKRRLAALKGARA